MSPKTAESVADFLDRLGKLSREMLGIAAVRRIERSGDLEAPCPVMFLVNDELVAASHCPLYAGNGRYQASGPSILD